MKIEQRKNEGGNLNLEQFALELLYELEESGKCDGAVRVHAEKVVRQAAVRHYRVTRRYIVAMTLPDRRVLSNRVPDLHRATKRTSDHLSSAIKYNVQ